MIACPECDALQREPRRVPRGTRVHCWRCDMVLIHESRRGMDFVFSMVVAGAVLFMIGNAFPLVSLEAQGNGVTTTLFGAILHLWQQEFHFVAALVLLTTILAPAFELGAMLFLTATVLRYDAGRIDALPAITARVLRAVQVIRPWGMLEVFMLGALVSIVKLGQMAAVVVGPALYSIGALILVIAVINSSFNPRDVWSRLPVVRDGAA